MPFAAPHTIRRQFLDVEVEGSEADALAVRRELAAMGELSTAIGLALDACAPVRGFLCIDRLDIDAGTLEWLRLARDLPGAVRRALEEALKLHVAASAGETPAGDSAIGEAPAARYRSALQTLDDALAYFLRNGSLPAGLHIAPGAGGLEQALIDGWAEAGPSGGSRAPLLRALGNPACRERLVRQFSPAFLEALLAGLAPRCGHGGEAVAAQIRERQLSGAGAAAVERAIWRAVFARVAVGEPPDIAGLAREALEGQTGPAAARGTAPLANRKAANAGGDGNDRGAAAESAPHPDAESGIFINNAGLVLLHPFLERLFEGLGLSAGAGLLQPERALALLHFLASGHGGAPEYELPLAKILCAVPLTQTVDAAIELGEAEKDEASALLEAVVKHWSALRDTGIDGLRGAFLLRQGKLSRRGDDWLLQVAPDTADILLGQLPWGFSPVRLAWMEQMLWVEWG